MRIGKLLFFVGLSLIAGFIGGRISALDLLHPDIAQNYTEPQMPIGQFDEMVSVDVIRNGDDIWIVDHKSGHIIFEFNKFKEVDRDSFGEYSQLLLETSGNEARGRSSFSYRFR